MKFGLFGSAQAKRGGADIDSGQGFRDFIEGGRTLAGDRANFGERLLDRRPGHVGADARLHHERPDGKGYPFGLRHEEIPVSARIVHVADTYDAMTTARAYRSAHPHWFAVAELQRYSGTQFDPASVAALIAAVPATSRGRRGRTASASTMRRSARWPPWGTRSRPITARRRTRSGPSTPRAACG